MVIFGAIMIVWSIYLKAPLEEPANPSVAPKSFQGSLVFPGPPGNAGVLRPLDGGSLSSSLIIIGLMATPFLDVNPRGTVISRSKNVSMKSRSFFLVS